MDIWRHRKASTYGQVRKHIGTRTTREHIILYGQVLKAHMDRDRKAIMDRKGSTDGQDSTWTGRKTNRKEKQIGKHKWTGREAHLDRRAHGQVRKQI
jgi:hypothetical protein